MDNDVQRRQSNFYARTQKDNRRTFCQRRETYSFVKAALYIATVILLALSFFAVNSAGEDNGAYDDDIEIAFLSIDPLLDASGEDSVFANSAVDPKFILGQELPVIYGVNIEEIYLENNVGFSDDPEANIYFDVMPEDIRLGILKFSTEIPKEFFVNAKGPQILIYHTHTQEAYRQIVGEEYVETGSWRTGDHSQSVVAIGVALKDELEDYGFTALHDTTNHEPPELKTSYSRSLETMLIYDAQYSNISMYIDVHRDAYGNIESGKKDFVTVNGDECARVMFVVGTGEGKTSEGFSNKPNYESNYKLAQAITNQLESMQEGFTRPIRVKTGRYNQHVSDMCVLIEVGHNANSLEHALNTTKYLALAISRILDVQ